MTVICFASNKGGVGKSTGAVNVAACLATLDPVLLVDLDAQAHCSLCLGLDTRSGLFDWLVSAAVLENCLLATRRDNLLWLLPGDSRTKTVESLYWERAGGFEQLISRLRGLQSPWVVIDTAAGGLLQEAAIAAADHLVVPFEPELLGMDGIYGTLKLAEQLNPQVALTLLPSMFDRRLREHRDSLEHVAAEFGAALAKPVPARSAVKRAISAGLTIWEYQDSALLDVRVAYALVCDRIRAFAHQKEEIDGFENEPETEA